MMTMTMDMAPNLTGWQGQRQLPDNPTLSTWDEYQITKLLSSTESTLASTWIFLILGNLFHCWTILENSFSIKS